MSFDTFAFVIACVFFRKSIFYYDMKNAFTSSLHYSSYVYIYICMYIYTYIYMYELYNYNLYCFSHPYFLFHPYPY